MKKALLTLLGLSAMTFGLFASEPLVYGPFGTDDDVVIDNVKPTIINVSLSFGETPAAVDDCIAVYRKSNDALCGLGKVVIYRGNPQLTLSALVKGETEVYFRGWQKSTGKVTDLVASLDGGTFAETVAMPEPGSVDSVLALRTGEAEPPVPVEPTVYAIAYELDGGVNAEENPASYTTNDLPIALAAPVREGYEFTGWTPFGEIPAGTTGDLTFTATWAEVPVVPPCPIRKDDVVIDNVDPTIFPRVALTFGETPMAAGDVVGMYRASNGELCGYGEAIVHQGEVLMNLGVQVEEGTQVYFRGWQKASGTQTNLVASLGGGAFVETVLMPEPGSVDSVLALKTPTACTVVVDGVALPVKVGGVVSLNAPFDSQTDGGTNVACVGWSGTGDVSSGTGTQCVFTVTQSSTLAWQYQTNYWFSASVSGEGSVVVGDAGFAADASGCWAPAGTNVNVAATGDMDMFRGWRDLSSGETVAETAELTVVMDASRRVEAVFGVRSVTHVTLIANRGKGGVADVTATNGLALPDLASAPQRTGYVFAGYDDDESDGVRYYGADLRGVRIWDKETPTASLYAQWTANTYSVAFDPNGGEGTMARIDGIAYDTQVSLPTCSFANGEQVFKGWARTADGKVAFEDGAFVSNLSSEEGATVTLYAVWKPARSSVVDDLEPIDVETQSFPATTYDGYLYDETDGAVAGTIQVKAAKAKDNKKTYKTTSKLTIGIQLASETKKISISGEYDLAAGGRQTFTEKKGRSVTLELGANGLVGSFEGCIIESVVNVFSLKDPVSKAKASVAEAMYVGTYNVFAEEGSLTVTVAKKGKVKVAGTLLDGKKISASAQLLVGDGVACAPFVVAKQGLAFSVWFGDELSVEGLTDAIVGDIKDGKDVVGQNAFYADTEALAAILETGGIRPLSEFIPYAVSVTSNGKKWTVARGEKAGKITYNAYFDDARDSIRSLNSAGLTLSHSDKTGTFTGSFKAYGIVGGKLKSYSAKVAGVLIGGQGYGYATLTINKVARSAKIWICTEALTVPTASSDPAFGVGGTVVENMAELRAALAAGADTIYLRNGYYNVQSWFAVDRGVSLIGESRENTVFTTCANDSLFIIEKMDGAVTVMIKSCTLPSIDVKEKVCVEMDDCVLLPDRMGHVVHNSGGMCNLTNCSLFGEAYSHKGGKMTLEHVSIDSPDTSLSAYGMGTLITARNCSLHSPSSPFIAYASARGGATIELHGCSVSGSNQISADEESTITESDE